MKNKFSLTISMEHINPDMVDVPVDVEYQSDDESFEVVQVSVSEDYVYKDKGAEFKFTEGEIIPCDSKMEEEIREKFSGYNPNEESYEYHPED